MPLLNPNSILGNPLAMAGLGLLSQPTRSRNPINPMASIMGGIQSAGAYQQNQQAFAGQQQELQMRQQQMQMEMEAALQKRQEEALARAEAERQRALIEQQIASLPPEQQAIARLNPEAYAKGAAGQMFQKPAAEPGPVQTYRLTHPEDVTLSGFDQWNRENKSSGATRITVGGEAKPVLDQASKYIMPDGTAPLPTMTPAEIVANGGRVLTKADISAADQAAKLRAKGEASNSAVRPAIDGYYNAVDKMRTAPSADTLAEAYQQRKRMAQVLAQARNPGRAPTDADVELAMADIPDPVSVSQAAGSALGGDPFKARMRVIEQELGVSDGRNPVSATGQIAPNDGWQDLGNGVRVRVKQ